MLCSDCGSLLDENVIVCPNCGKIIDIKRPNRSPGVESIRQGKRARELDYSHWKQQIDKEEKRRKRAGASHTYTDHTGSYTENPEGITITATGPFNYDGIEEQWDTMTDLEDDNTVVRKVKNVYSEEFLSEEAAEIYSRTHGDRGIKKVWVNWVKIGVIAFCSLILVIVGCYFFLTKSTEGQKIMARLGQNANSAALWAVGEEKMDAGDIMGAIRDFEQAELQDQEAKVIDVNGLLMLGTAYEAAGMIDEAAELYERIYTDTPSRSEAYINHIRILLASDEPGNRAKAGELMKLAYDKTGNKTFATQRGDLLPAPPEVDLTAGYYESKKYIAITSYQGYDVYYTFDENAVLPAGGTKFTDRIFLDEGIHSLRAVAVNGELVSDELKGTYKIIMPSPQTPRANLAPNTYKNRQRVRLKPGKDNEKDTDIVIYYTIDGSPPDADSPIFDGNDIILPTGRVTLKAVAVNQYGKVSNTLEILYKIEAKPWPLSAYTYEDVVNGLKLYSTTMTDFQKQFGEGKSQETITLPDYTTECRKYTYDWGYAVMTRIKSGWVLAELYFTSQFKGPRGTGIGDTESFVTGKFRDMGQIASASGNRGLYMTSDGTGKIWVQENGTKIIRYKCNSTDGHMWQLDYILNRSGTVSAIDMLYLP